jgi:hypothetical protein
MNSHPSYDELPDPDEARPLRQLWHETTPPEPARATWHRVLSDLTATQRQLVRTRRRRRLAMALATAAALLLVVGGVARLFGPHVPVAPVEVAEVLPVAAGDEVVVLRVEGADTQTLVVGQLPVHGPIELADPGDVVLTSLQPDARDNMVPRVSLDGPRRPMIWAPVAAEAEED